MDLLFSRFYDWTFGIFAILFNWITYIFRLIAARCQYIIAPFIYKMTKNEKKRIEKSIEKSSNTSPTYAHTQFN